MTTQQRKVIFSATIAYTIFILYIMFLAFGRTDNLDQVSDYTFIFLPDSFFRGLSLSELLHPTLMNLVDFGNVAAFIPFGILLPLLYRTSFVRFIALFILSIAVLETIQALTLLGSFDINDIIQNSLGAAIGFAAYKFGNRAKSIWKNIVVMGVSIAAFMIVILGIFEIVDRVFTQEIGPFVALNELKDSTGNASTGTKRYSFMIDGENVEPQYNVYNVTDKHRETYTYSLGNKELYLYLNYGIPDQEEIDGSITVSVDGQEFLSTSAEEQRQEPNMLTIYVERANELTITIEGNEKLWDIGFKEMIYSWNWANLNIFK